MYFYVVLKIYRAKEHTAQGQHTHTHKQHITLLKWFLSVFPYKCNFVQQLNSKRHHQHIEFYFVYWSYTVWKVKMEMTIKIKVFWKKEQKKKWVLSTYQKEEKTKNATHLTLFSVKQTSFKCFSGNLNSIDLNCFFFCCLMLCVKMCDIHFRWLQPVYNTHTMRCLMIPLNDFLYVFLSLFLSFVPIESKHQNFDKRRWYFKQISKPCYWSWTNCFSEIVFNKLWWIKALLINAFSRTRKKRRKSHYR